MKLLQRLWARLLFQDRGVIPTKRLIYLIAFASVILICLSYFFFDLWLFGSWLIGLMLVSLVDLTFSPRRGQLALRRECPDEIERHQQAMITLTIKNNSTKSCLMKWTDDLPLTIETKTAKSVVLPVNQTLNVEQVIVPNERGLYPINKIYVRYQSQFGLWEKQRTFEQSNELKVIPNMEESRDYLMHAQKYLLHEGEKIRKQKTGLGEFSKVRQYVVGDDPRKINWYQSAKLHEMMVNEYEPEHGKHVVIMIDCGRMMGVELKKGNKLERHIEAALTVATAALNNGDYVSLVAFAKEVKAYIPPAKGMAHLQTILKTIYNIEVEANESSYTHALQYIQTQHRKRSMILLFSDINQFFIDAHALFFIKQLQRKHLFVVMGIEDEWVKKTVQLQVGSLNEAMRKTIAQGKVVWKKREMIKWNKQGLDLIEAEEEQLAVSAISYYIDQLNRSAL
ncbi:DUF58 domain-containing protein [Amphibacillus cookii]|uniref:DUF58 domain-containing protein n=1 Tax=Amphibacillus cookii TaxID=767787 RepID=UPI00195C0913|nr:DUF58 domain-containing protein [Amphibacillus cookii]MBM7542085.1 uncharacterized protein (DUF58 family) [Amphibacillus cookii]